MQCKRKFYIFKLINFLVWTLQCAETLILAMKTWKKTPSKVAHNQSPIFFQYCQPAQNQPKSQFLFNRNCSPGKSRGYMSNSPEGESFATTSTLIHKIPLSILVICYFRPYSCCIEVSKLSLETTDSCTQEYYFEIIWPHCALLAWHLKSEAKTLCSHSE